MRGFFNRLMWALALPVSQGLVFNHIRFLGYATPLIYIYILCLQPLNASRYAWLSWGFAVGLGADFFSETPGLGAASMTLTALCAPQLLRLFAPKDCVEDMVPSFRTLGGWKYFWYVTLLVLLQEACVVALETFSFFNALDMLYTCLGSSVLSLLLILSLEKMRGAESSRNSV